MTCDLNNSALSPDRVIDGRLPAAPSTGYRQRMSKGDIKYWLNRGVIEAVRAAESYPPGRIARNKFLLQVVGNQLFWLLESYGHRLDSIVALDPFSGSGLLMSHTYLRVCHHADLWEIEPQKARQAKRLGANVTVHCGDSIEAVQCGDNRLGDYNFIMLDNNIGGCYGPDRRYCEHFEMIPAIFRYLRKGNRAVVVVNYVPDVDRLAADPRFVPDNLEEHLRRRQEFFQTTGRAVRPAQAAARYAEAAGDSGWTLAHYGIVPRNAVLNFLVLMLLPAT
jgi:hypothetical protein